MSYGVQTTLNGLYSKDEQHSLNVEMAHLGHFPKMKNRTQWNPLWPELPTIWRACEYIVFAHTELQIAVSAVKVNDELIKMGFPAQKVKRTVAATMAGNDNMVKINRREYPCDGGKSWALYVWGKEAADEMNARDAVLAKWLNDPANIDRVHDVLSTTCALGLDRFKPKKGWGNDVSV